MSDDLVSVVCGAVILLAGAWFVPHQMRVIRRRLVERGADPARFDAIVEGALFKTVRAVVTVAGAIALVTGLYWLLRG